ncbi:hypothetical protein DY000_02021346 [Brassica cretica]|uniref:Uncharacterized protein n=1 Tax=Brassica cretica TaxID=69181 RepID=A0ABQ7E7Z0_BRACR|nr:hypothetical protein DY000_02021346 [Brassica cretica]
MVEWSICCTEHGASICFDEHGVPVGELEIVAWASMWSCRRAAESIGRHLHGSNRRDQPVIDLS